MFHRAKRIVANGKQVLVVDAEGNEGHLADAANELCADLIVGHMNSDLQRDDFDYMAECDKTCSTVFRPEQVEVMDLRHVLIGIVGFANDLNVIKKLLFRGKTREELNFPEAVGPTLEDVIKATNWSPADIDVLHGAIGAITEAGEVAGYLLRWSNGEGFDRVNVMEEAGDMSWYIVRSLRGIGVTLDQSNRANIDKLRCRHGAAFDVFRDANRDLAAEHTKLEDAFVKSSSAPLFDEPEVVKNPCVAAAMHQQGKAHIHEAHGEIADMAERIAATDVQPVPPGGVRSGPIGDCEGMDC